MHRRVCVSVIKFLTILTLVPLVFDPWKKVNSSAIMSEVLSRWELKVNWKKMRVMRVARQRGCCEVRVGDREIEQVDEMKYLGVTISSDGNMEKEVEARIGSAVRMIWRHE